MAETPDTDQAAFDALYERLPGELKEDDAPPEVEPAEADGEEEAPAEPNEEDEDYERAYLAAKSIVPKNILEKLSREDVMALGEKADKANAAFAKMKAENGHLKTNQKGASQTREDPDGTGEPSATGRTVAVELTDEIQSFSKALTEHLGDEGLGKAVSAPLESLTSKVNAALESVAQSVIGREASFMELARVLMADTMRQRLGDRLSELRVDDEGWEAVDRKARQLLQATPQDYATDGELTARGIREAYEDALAIRYGKPAIQQVRSAARKRTQTKTNGQATVGASRAITRTETPTAREVRLFNESIEKHGIFQD